jgi:dihydrofolate reductase
MSQMFVDISMSLDGFIAGPNDGPQNPLGDGGAQLHQWMYDVESWRERQSLTAGQTNQDDEVVKESFARTGAYVIGSRMFGEVEVAWPDPPPFRTPVFVLTHHAREPWVRLRGTTFTFVTGGMESALEQARAAADNKDIRLAGGANSVRQFIEAGLIDELQIHLAPVLFGDGVRLFEHTGPEHVQLESTGASILPRSHISDIAS